MAGTDEVLLQARAVVLRDLEATGVADATSVSALETALAGRRWWLVEWPAGAEFVAGLVAQDVQDALLDGAGRWPLCRVCEEGVHALHIHPDLGGPGPRWVCEETGREISPLGGLHAVPGGGLSGGGATAT